MRQLSYGDVQQAADRVRGHVRPVVVAPPDPGDRPWEVWFALEFLQHTGSFKARGAANFLRAHAAAGDLTGAGVTIASGGNAGLACAWAARSQGVPATVFLPANAPAVKVAKLEGYGAAVRLVDGEYADAAAACARFAEESGALRSHAYDDPFVAAGAGTLLDEIRARVPGLDTVVVAVGGGGLFAGVATAAREHGVRVLAVEPENCRALNAALAAGRPVDVTVDSIAADSLGARRTSEMALHAAQQDNARSVLVPDRAIAAARRTLWEHHRIAAELGGATALAALPPFSAPTGHGYLPAPGEKVAVILCGANTDPSDLALPAR